MEGRLAVLGQERHHFLTLGGAARQGQRLFGGDREGDERHHPVADLLLLFHGVGQKAGLLHAAQQRRQIVAQGLTELVLGQRAVLQ